MAGASDETTLSEALACEIAGVAPAKRRDWVRRGVIDQPSTSAHLNELQVIELAAVRELHDVLGPRDAAVTWAQLGGELHGSLSRRWIFAVVDLAYRHAQLAHTPRELVAAVSTSRAVRVIPLMPLVSDVRDAFRRLASRQR